MAHGDAGCRIRPHINPEAFRMKRLAVIILAALLCALTACNAAVPADTGNTAAPTAVPITAEPTAAAVTPVPAATDAPAVAPEKTPADYAETYAFYKEKLVPALTARVSADLAAAKQALEEREPGLAEEDAAYFNPVIPFISMGMELTAGFCDGMDAAFVQSSYGDFGYEGVEYTLAAPGSYRVCYSDELEDGSVFSYEDSCEYSEGSIRYRSETNGSVIDFCECVALGGGVYALQSLTCRALVTMKDGVIREYSYSETVYEIDWDAGKPTSASVTHDAEADSIWNRTDLTEEWVTECADHSPLRRVFILNSDGLLTCYGCRQSGYGEDAVFEPFEPVNVQIH